MGSSAIDSMIHGALFSTDEMREIFSDRSWVQKWLDTEAALAKAQGELGVIPKEKRMLLMNMQKPICLIFRLSVNSIRVPLQLYLC